MPLVRLDNDRVAPRQRYSLIVHELNNSAAIKKRNKFRLVLIIPLGRLPRADDLLDADFPVIGKNSRHFFRRVKRRQIKQVQLCSPP